LTFSILASHGVASCDDVNLITKLSAKKAIIEQARQWPNYFSRFFPVSVGFRRVCCPTMKCLFFCFFKIPKIHSGETQMLGVSHSGIRLLKRTRTKTHEDVLQVLETVRFDNIQQISSIRNSSTIDLRLIKKKLLTIHSHRVSRFDFFFKLYSTFFDLDTKNQTVNREIFQRISFSSSRKFLYDRTAHSLTFVSR